MLIVLVDTTGMLCKQLHIRATREQLRYYWMPGPMFMEPALPRTHSTPLLRAVTTILWLFSLSEDFCALDRIPQRCLTWPALRLTEICCEMLPQVVARRT